MKILHGSVHAVDDTANFARVVSYVCKMFMKLTTGINVTNRFVATDASAREY